MTDRAYDFERLKLLTHYVVSAAGSRANFGAVKLYKVMWFSEARCFVLHGRSITGSPYVRQKFGPIPRDGIRAREALVSENSIKQWRGTNQEWVFKSVTNPIMSFLNVDERAEVDRWIRHIDEDHTASSTSEESHDYGWELAKIGEVLPLYSVLAGRVRVPNAAELDWAKSRAKELGLP
jgi:Protein of unknown function (DUF4065)